MHIEAVVTPEQTTPGDIQTGAPSALRKLRLTLFFATLILAFLRAWAARQTMDPDGIDYLDMADAYLKRDWHTALNGLWSPLYSWVLGAMMFFKPSAAWEFPIVHAVNAAIFFVMLLCFDYLLVTWIEVTWIKHQQEGRAGTTAQLPDWACVVLGYGLVIFTSLDWMTMEDVGPDHLVAAAVFLASALVLQLQRSDASYWTSAALGAVLGLGYLAKAPMFPISILFFVLLLIYLPNHARRRQLLISIACFLIVALPFMTALSISKGRITFGDSGKLNYAWHVNRKPMAHWRGEPGQAIAKHPTRQINTDPAVYEFDGPINATYPVSYDPSYWEEGLSPRFQRWLQLAALKNNSIVAIKMSFQSAPLWIVIAFLLASGWGLHRWGNRDVTFGLLLICASVLGMYLVVHLEPRYVAPFAVIAVLFLYSVIRLPDTFRSRKLFVTTTLALITLLCIFEIGQTFVEIKQAARDTHEQLAVANALHEMGLHSGDKVGNIGDSYIAFWARLARVSIITEVPQPQAERFWHSDAAIQKTTLDSMIGTGAKAIVTLRPPVDSPNWRRIGKTEYFFFRPGSDQSAATRPSQ